jgi:hypothetical protein
MTPMKVKVLIVLFAYSGNGGIPGTIPALVWWVARTYWKIKNDPRVSDVAFLELCDTPITMTRNRAVETAQKGGYDMLLMLDSDNEPDGYLGHDPRAKPFWETAFDLAYSRLLQGKPTVAFAPYCGTPQHPTKPNAGEIPYLFQWTTDASDELHVRWKLDVLTRLEAAQLRGIHQMGAGPTGVSLWTTNCWPKEFPKPYFAYEWNESHSEKQSTEDCFATRNVSLWWQMKTGDNPLFALCDSWALHHKVKLVGRPNRVYVENIAKEFRDAINDNASMHEERRQVDFEANGREVPSDEEVERMVRAARFNSFGHREEAPRDEPPVNGPYDPGEDSDLEDDKPLQVSEDSDLEDLLDSTPLESNGKPSDVQMVGKLIGGRKIQTINGQLPLEDLKRIGEIGRYVGQKNKGGARVVLVHPWSGEAAAMLLANLPERSALFCIGASGKPQVEMSEAAFVALREFSKSFKDDLDGGRVHYTDTDTALAQAYKMEPQEADLVFIATAPEAAVTVELIDAWARHLAPNGILAGCGYDEDNPDTKLAVMEFCDRLALADAPRVLETGSLWFIPSAQILAARKPQEVAG